MSGLAPRPADAAERYGRLLLWAGALVLAAIWILPRAGAAFADGVPVPVSHDSFYHARRILDAIAGPAMVREFDPRIHAPEGSWVTWPWAYDAALAALVRALRWVWPGVEPMSVLVPLPALALALNVGLLLWLAARLELRFASSLLVAVAYVCSPMVVFAHAVGNLDHHWAEGLAVLVAMATGLRWLADPDRTGAAAAHGLVLGLAHGIHNELLILQLPTLIVLAAAWLARRPVPAPAVAAWGAGLLGGLLVVLLPSAAFRAGSSAFYVLGWFHLQAACAGLLVALVATRALPSVRSVAAVAALALLLALPLLNDVRHGLTFIEGGIPFLENIVEAYSFPELVARRGWAGFAATHAWLPFLLPAMAWGAHRLLRRRFAPGALLLTWLLLGFAMYWQQLRMWYFALPAMLLCLGLFVQDTLDRTTARNGAVAMLACAVLAGAIAWPVVPTLRARYPLGADEFYAMTRPLLRELADACRREPGIVLADRHLGHLITYETDCAVIADNFILTRQHVDKIRQANALLALEPDALLQAQPPIRYLVLVAPYRAIEDFQAGRPVEVAADATPLVRRLLMAPEAEPGFRPIGELVADRGDARLAVARSFELAPEPPPVAR